jgi:hypothetical protein
VTASKRKRGREGAGGPQAHTAWLSSGIEALAPEPLARVRLPKVGTPWKAPRTVGTRTAKLKGVFIFSFQGIDSKRSVFEKLKMLFIFPA